MVESERTDTPMTRQWLQAMLLAAGYFAIAALTLRYTRFNGGVALIWGATALLLAFLVVRPRREWLPPILACGLSGALATAILGLGGGVALPFAVINIGEAVGGALLLRRLLPGKRRFESLDEIGIFLGIAGIAMPAACGLLAAATANVVVGVPFARNWFDYFAGHGLGAITFTPLIMLASGGDAGDWARGARRREWAEAAVLFPAMAAATAVTFYQTSLPLLFLPLLPMIIAVFRIGRLGAAVTIGLLTVIALGFTLEGRGPISLIHGDTGLHAQFLQFYLACAVMIVLPAAAELKHRKLMFAQLQRLSAVARLVLDRTGDIIMTLEIDGTIRYVSPSIQALAGYAPEDLIGRTPHCLIHDEDVDQIVQTHRRALGSPNDTFIVEYRARRADGQFAWYEVHTRATLDENGQPSGVVSSIREISARKSHETELVREAQTDPLTGLFNRRAFDAALAQRFTAATPFTIVLFDLDHFKAINDTYGHDTGDEVIRDFAEHLQRMLRKGDVVARFGGEEFVAILDGADAASAREVCERLRITFAQHSRKAADGRPFRATMSGGIAAFQPGMDGKQLLAEADAALYRAKSEGRNRLALAA